MTGRRAVKDMVFGIRVSAWLLCVYSFYMIEVKDSKVEGNSPSTTPSSMAGRSTVVKETPVLRGKMHSKFIGDKKREKNKQTKNTTTRKKKEH